MSNNVPASQPEKPQKAPLPTDSTPTDVMTYIEQHFSMEGFAGPLPAPEILVKYKEVDPSFPERIFSTFEKQSAHRQELETKYLDAQINSQKRGALFAFSFGMSLVVLTAVLTIFRGWSWLGISLIWGFIAAALWAYALVNKANRVELGEKRDMVERK